MDDRAGGPSFEIARLVNELVNYNQFEIGILTTTPLEDCVNFHCRVHFHHLEKYDIYKGGWIRTISEFKRICVNYDTIFVTGVWGLVDGLSIYFLHRKRIIVRVCGMLEPYILKRNRFKKALARFLYVNSNIRSAESIIVNSLAEAEKIYYSKIRHNKLHIIPNGLSLFEGVKDKSTYRKMMGFDSNDRVLLYLGRIHPKKGLHLLISALGNVTSKKSRIKLVVAGEFSDIKYSKTIMNLIRSNNLDDKIIFSGNVSGEEKSKHFILADSFILPSESEGMPNAVLEALSFGLPCIVTRGCNLPEIGVQHAGLVVDFNIDSLSNALTRFENDTSYFNSASFRASALLDREYSIKKMADLYYKLINAS